jgi:hypothetical protein
MKKLLSIILIFAIFITFTTYASASPPRQIIIRSEEELTKMREMAEAFGITAYLIRTGYYDNGLRYRADVVAFLELLDSLPIPHGEGMRFSSLIYYPNWIHENLSMFFDSENGEWHVFNFRTRNEREEGVVERMFGEEVSLLYISQDNRMKVYSPPSIWGNIPDENGNFFFPMEIDGYYIMTRYLPEKNANTSMIIPENIYKNMTVTTIRDLTWIERYVSGDIYGEGFVTTANALEILRFVVGLENDIWGRTSAMAAADVNGDGVIDAADALEILRIVVGLSSGEVGLGDVEDDVGVVTTSDALEILRAATGLATLTDAEKVRLGISGEPTTADALRVLRVAVGLS